MTIQEKPDTDVRGEEALDVEHELPPGDDNNEAGGESPRQPGPEELARTRAERDALYDRLARLQAEFDNFRKRSQREQAEFREFAVADAARTLLPILDSLERAAHSQKKGDDLRGGVELILRQFQDALVKIGVSAVEATGKQFDPKQHEAIEMVDRDDVADHEIIDELQRGYKLKDRLLRPAMVRVARNPKK